MNYTPFYAPPLLRQPTQRHGSENAGFVLPSLHVFFFYRNLLLYKCGNRLPVGVHSKNAGVSGLRVGPPKVFFPY